MMASRGGVLLFLLVFCSACSTGPAPDESQTAYSNHHVTIRNHFDPGYGPHPAVHTIAPAAGTSRDMAGPVLAYEAGREVPGHCRLKDRFDRKTLIAYHFDGDQARLGLDVDMDGFGLSDFGSFDLEEVRLAFKYRLQPIRKKRERCLYRSSWQGLLGSGYNELMLREQDTIYQELEQELDRAGRKVDELFGF